MQKKLTFVLLFLCYMPLFAQTEHEHALPNCNAPEFSQFDFWIGEWDLYWEDSLRGTNTVRKGLDNCSIEENFSEFNDGLQGKSWSVYNPKKQKWQQTWIDNKGSYLLFEGALKGDTMTLQHEKTTTTGEQILFQMLFHHIKPDSFDWAWQRSKDKGRTWETQWQIHYQRHLPAATAQDIAPISLKQQLTKGKGYFLVLLKSGKNRKQNEKTSADIQTQHLQHLFWLHEQGKLNIMGPATDPKGKLRGIAIYNLDKREDVIKCIEEDPAVKSGRLTYEIYEWFGISGFALGE